MSPKKGPVLVIDASVARAAGGPEATATRSIACRDCLIEVRENGLLLTMSPAIKAEWKNHWSNYSRRWFFWMMGSRRVVKVRGVPNSDLILAISNLALERERDAAEDDSHLVAAALESDYRIMSLDERARALFVTVSASMATLVLIHWVNAEDRGVLDWLRDRCPERRAFQLR